MKVIPYTDASAFRDRVHSVLSQNEAENCLGLGIIDTIINVPDRYPRYHLLAVEDAGLPVGAAWMTPPHPLGITRMPEAALPALVAAARALPHPVGSVVGPKPTVERFKDGWGTPVKNTMEQRIYQLTEVANPSGVGGAMRLVADGDRALLTAWRQAFTEDCGMPSTPQSAAEAADFALKMRNRVFWVDAGQPVAMAGFSGRTPSGIRISWVYTPRYMRGRGYASALVAALSQRQLDEGRKFCFLYTDLANPTSNGIYQKIGYRAVCDSAHYVFA
jgi:predicted GNAT family acetyltransferase